MKKHYLLFLLFLFSELNNASAQYTWTQKANYPGGERYGAAAFSIGDKGYFGTGLDSSIILRKDFWQYDTLSNTWTQKADYGGAARFGATAFSVGNYGYMGLGTTYYDGGSNYDWSTDFWEYDPTSNIWTQKGNFPGQGRYATGSFTIGNKGYMGCGWDGSDFNDFWEYNPATDTWTQKASVGGGGRESSTGFVVNNKGYIALGLNGGSTMNDLWEYDTLANTWTQKASFPGTARYGATSFVLCSYAYIGLGSVQYPTEEEVRDFWRYDPSADSWTQIVNFPGSARNGAIDFVIGDNAYIGTGAASTALTGFTSDLWKFSSDSCGAVVIPPPVASFQSSDSTICINTCINFTDHSTNATSWQWSFPGASLSSSTDQNPQNVCYFVAGHYDVTLIASNSGGTDTMQLINYITVNVAPVTPVIVQSHDTLYCSTDPSYISYQWYYFNVPITGAIDTSLVVSFDGNYNVEVTNKFGCSIAVGINVILGLDEVELYSNVNLYPNPVSNELNMSMLKSLSKLDVEVNDMLGRKLFQRSFDFAIDNKLTIDFDSFAPGIYFISMTADGERVTKKVVKESPNGF